MYYFESFSVYTKYMHVHSGKICGEIGDLDLPRRGGGKKEEEEEGEGRRH